jgi:hypothetical protein
MKIKAKAWAEEIPKVSFLEADSSQQRHISIIFYESINHTRRDKERFSFWLSGDPLPHRGKKHLGPI